MSLLSRPLLSVTQPQPWCRHISSSTRKILTDPRKLLLKIPQPSVSIDDVRNETNENRKTPAMFLKHRETMKKRFPTGWNPPRKLSREAMEGLRMLHLHDPATFTTPVLAERFRISSEAVRRILRSQWTPSKEEKAKLLERERKRKQEYIARSVEKEREDKWAMVDRLERLEEEKEEKKDALSLV